MSKKALLYFRVVGMPFVLQVLIIRTNLITKDLNRPEGFNSPVRQRRISFAANLGMPRAPVQHVVNNGVQTRQSIPPLPPRPRRPNSRWPSVSEDGSVPEVPDLFPNGQGLPPASPAQNRQFPVFSAHGNNGAPPNIHVTRMEALARELADADAAARDRRRRRVELVNHETEEALPEMGNGRQPPQVPRTGQAASPHHLHSVFDHAYDQAYRAINEAETMMHDAAVHSLSNMHPPPRM